MRIVTANVNGIRSAADKGFFAWLVRQRADVVCLQEVRADETRLAADRRLRPPSLHAAFHPAERKGYSGTAVYSRLAPRRVVRGAGIDWIDREGRWLEAWFGNLVVVSAYLPSGSSGEARQAFKDEALVALRPRLDALRDQPLPVVVCGDLNIAHTDRDLRNWRQNRKSSGCLAHERTWLDELFANGWFDAFRALEQPEHEYTWWSQRGAARANNVGWRLDYHLAGDELAGRVLATRVYRDRIFSDHAPVAIDYALDVSA